MNKKRRTFAIGDVQGCLSPLQALLEKILYDPSTDELWFTGDIVNRGPDSLLTCRFIKSLPSSTVCVLGNHDLSLLACAAGRPMKPSDTFDDILAAPDKEDLIQWLQHRPLLHHDPQLGFTLTHAGIYPAWDLATAQRLANELENVLRGPEANAFLDEMYGYQPPHWEESLTGGARLRFITNALTRMRLCRPDGSLDFTVKERNHVNTNLIPWFDFPGRRTQNDKLLFGHWAALKAHCDTPRVYPLDSGCVWGNCLTAFCLETEQRTTVDC